MQIRKGIVTVCCFLMLSAFVQASSKKSRQPVRNRPTSPLLAVIDKAMGDLSWSSEGEDDLRVFFVASTPEADVKKQIIAWTKKLPLTYRPEGYTTVETNTLDELLEGVLNPEPDKKGSVDDDEARAAVQWGILRDVLVTNLSDVQAYWLGSEINYQVIVLVGRDKAGNLAGVWMRHWSS